MKSKKIFMRSVEITLGLAKLEDVVDFDVRGILRDSISQMEEEMGESLKRIKMLPYDLKLACMKFYENACDLAEAENGAYFSPKHLQEALIKIMNGNPLNMMGLLKNNNIIKN